MNCFQKYFISLFFLALSSEIIIRAEVVAGQQLNTFEKRPLTKFNAFDDDGIIILAAYRRRGGSVRGKYKKVIATTTEKAVKILSTEPVKLTTEPTTTTKSTATTEKAVQSTTEKVIKVTTEESVKVTKDIKPKTVPVVRRSQLTIEDQQNALWLARKRVTRPPKAVQPKKAVKVNVVDEEEYSLRRARYLFTQRLG